MFFRATYRLGPELEVPGYSCEDHFLEEDTYMHSWECVAQLLDSDLTDDILCDIGMPVIHKSVRYNCRVFLLNRKIIFIRPKMILASDGNYRENRWFYQWRKRNVIEDYQVPKIVRQVTGQDFVPFGDGALLFEDTCLASEICEELFAPESRHTELSLCGVEIFGNGSGSHHQLRKLSKRIDLIKNATAKNGGVYVYSNHQCCDGSRLYFDGCAMIALNGKLLAQGSQFSMKEVEVVTATFDPFDIREYRGSVNSRGEQASHQGNVPTIYCPFSLGRITSNKPSTPIEEYLHDPMEEIAFGPSCWLWDYLRRSTMKGFFLPLSGGADSSCTAALVGIMCKQAFREIQLGNETVIADCKRITGVDDISVIESSEMLCSKIFHTCYMGTDNSSEETRTRAENVAKEIGATFHEINIQKVVNAFTETFTETMGKTPKFKAHGGSGTEDIALQNIQARSRMIFSYMMAQLIPWLQDKYGSLLVLGSANVDETLRGYFTKYDCSSADVNPIGGISKVDLKKFLLWASVNPFVNYTTLESVANATPTAELVPLTDDNLIAQSDEEDMGMSYQELSRFGTLRKVNNCGPLSMFKKLIYEWDHLTATEVAEKVKRFFFYYSINRHKTTILTPSYHAENYSPDDNRYDLRPFLYNSKWSLQFKKIDELASILDSD
eukprot:TRINITY_DN2295_c0_g1_i2.p1 TRINITY_DN2295_c0_g1~~TRINITY_DN2295_c0_g1_i2.p1  ORF type:complete len:666 (+),score=141.16 TRINITY_DN2295_c0_g1_i2:357-2354(+)